MKKEYRLKHIDQTIISEDIWESIPSISIDSFPWNESNYMPSTQVKMFYTDSHFHLYFKCYENNIRATYLSNFEPVYKDSCLEFFFQPLPLQNEAYLNFEINPFGTLLLGLGKDRGSRRLLQEVDSKIFNIRPSISTEYNSDHVPVNIWSIKYSIPFTFIENYFGQVVFKPGTKICGNFYKCGDGTLYPHYGCWNPITLHSPDFHRPDFFGDLIFT